MEPGGGAAVIYRVCSLVGLEDEVGASVVGMWNGAASELNGAVSTWVTESQAAVSGPISSTVDPSAQTGICAVPTTPGPAPSDVT